MTHAKNPSANQVANKLIVQKYGGATVASPEKIKQIAERISHLHKKGFSIIVVVSAMGHTTDQLIDLAQQVSKNPNKRELDMLLSTGERISMSLLSMALNDLDCDAISFTGSQAGVLTSDSHLNAIVTQIRAPRVEEAIKQNKIVVLAGFQGVCPQTKEITTLGRGGSDITAIAMAAALKAKQCEILKDVAGVFSADPKLIKNAKPIRRLSYQQLMEITFWGAKVLHYRSVELAARNQVSLYIGPADSHANGTIVDADRSYNANSTNFNAKSFLKLQMTSTEIVGEPMLESNHILSLNSHDLVVRVLTKNLSINEALCNLREFCQHIEITDPQLLNTSKGEMLITGPKENITSLINSFQSAKENLQEKFKIKFDLDLKKFSTIAATCTGSSSIEMSYKVADKLAQAQITAHNLFLSPMSVIVLVDQEQKEKALQALHELLG